MKVNGWQRMFRYAGVYAQRIIVLFICFSVIWCVYMMILDGEFTRKGLEETLAFLPVVLLFCSSLIQMIFTSAYVPVLLNQFLAMGATRRESTFGLIVAHILIVLETTVIGTVVHRFMPGFLHVENSLYCVYGIGGGLLSIGLGLVAAVLIDRFGKVAYYIIVVGLAMIAGGFGGLSTIVLGGFSVDVSGLLGRLLPPVGLGGLVVGSVIFYLAIRKKEVKV